MANEIQTYITNRVQEVAYQLKLPFRLKELLKYAEKGVVEAQRTRGGRLYQEELFQHFKECIDKALNEAVADGSLKEDGKAGKRPLTDEHIRIALEVFPKADQWETLIEGCGYEEAWVLGVFLKANRDEFEGSLDDLQRINLQRIESYARQRRMVLMLSQEGAKLINISAPFWAARFWRRAREENVSGVERGPDDRHTVSERGGYRRIAASLSQPGEEVTDKQVKTWLDRLREYPEFKDWLDRWGPEPEIEFEGGLDDFWLSIADPPAWRRNQRRLNRGNQG